jgi:lysophospholipase L1-like esterase
MNRRYCRCNPAVRERTRQAVNAFIRTSGVFDGVFDLDLLLRDPLDRTRLDPAYDSGDHLHPNALGLRLIGEVIPLRLLERAVAQPRQPQRSRPLS